MNEPNIKEFVYSNYSLKIRQFIMFGAKLIY